MKSQLMIDWETAMETQRKKHFDERIDNLSWGTHIVLDGTKYKMNYSNIFSTDFRSDNEMYLTICEFIEDRDNLIDRLMFTKFDEERSVNILVKIDGDSLPVIEEEILREVLKEVLVRSVIST